MSSSRLILLFLTIIFLIIVILSSTRIATSLRTRFEGLIPKRITVNETNIREDELTPKPTIVIKQSSPTPIPTFVQKSTPSGETPATGPVGLVWMIIASSFLAGSLLKKLKP